jgi:hypothetical protein
MHQRRVACSDNDFCGRKVYQGQKSISHFQHDMETVLHRNEVWMNEEPCSKTTSQASVMVGERSELLSTALPRKTERVRDMILDDGRVQQSWFCSWNHPRPTWIPKQFTGAHKHNRLTICQHLLNGCRKGGDASLRRIVMGTRCGSTITLQKANDKV